MLARAGRPALPYLYLSYLPLFCVGGIGLLSLSGALSREQGLAHCRALCSESCSLSELAISRLSFSSGRHTVTRRGIEPVRRSVNDLSVFRCAGAVTASTPNRGQDTGGRKKYRALKATSQACPSKEICEPNQANAAKRTIVLNDLRSCHQTMAPDAPRGMTEHRKFAGRGGSDRDSLFIHYQRRLLTCHPADLRHSLGKCRANLVRDALISKLL